MSKRCRILCDTEHGVLSYELVLPRGASIAEALAAAGAQLGPVVDWDRAPAGIFGQLRSRDYVPADGDRIELYRPLQVDPRARRRAQAAQRRPTRGGSPRG